MNYIDVLGLQTNATIIYMYGSMSESFRFNDERYKFCVYNNLEREFIRRCVAGL